MRARELMGIVAVGLVVAVVFCGVGSIGLHFFSGSGDYAVELPGGYRLIRTNASTVAIWSPPVQREFGGVGEDCVVPPTVTRIAVRGPLAFGLVETNPSSDPGHEPAPGYFVLDTQDGKVLLKLDKEKWLEALKEHGLSEEPELEKPSRWLKTGA